MNYDPTQDSKYIKQNHKKIHYLSNNQYLKANHACIIAIKYTHRQKINITV